MHVKSIVMLSVWEKALNWLSCKPTLPTIAKVGSASALQKGFLQHYKTGASCLGMVACDSFP